MATEAQIRAKKNYRKKTKQITIEFNIETEKEILNHILSQDNKSRYIKDLIKNDINIRSEK